jgi:hypothetical protein
MPFMNSISDAVGKKNLLSQSFGDHPVFADEELAVMPLLSYVLELVVPHILHFEDENSRKKIPKRYNSDKTVGQRMHVVEFITYYA